MKMSEGMRKKGALKKYLFHFSPAFYQLWQLFEKYKKKMLDCNFYFKTKTKQTKQKTKKRGKMKIYGKIQFFFKFSQFLQRFEIYSIRDHKVHLR